MTYPKCLNRSNELLTSNSKFHHLTSSKIYLKHYQFTLTFHKIVIIAKNHHLTYPITVAQYIQISSQTTFTRFNSSHPKHT
ncbi:hypothetical protein VIGAN_01297700 [Vigna angularis var. angularis]|uniref:Uncharacterized protein n=1 Tax=Vigna angularis var. angularis TaxID=157739 RepID=A0A0S3R372_PHAAN|nr:hypothetical protein VIGAN_01297700 [Vigna angularis var. angularis]